MKKLIAIILSLVFVLSFAACGNKPADNGDSNTPTESGYYFTVNGVKVEMNALASSVTDALGEPKSYTEEASCAFEGLDKTYGYGGYYISTYPDGDKDYIYSAWFVDDSITTEEGVYIGSTKAEVETAYGADCFGDSTTATLTKGDTKLIIILTDDAVSSIQYQAVVE